MKSSSDAGPAGLPEDAVEVGRVGRPHGVRGELRVIPESGEPARLTGLTEAWLVHRSDRRAPDARRHVVRAVRVHGDVALMTLEGIDDRDEAQGATHAELWARREELPARRPDEFGVADVIGMELWDGERPVGRVKGVVSVSGRDHFEVEVAPSLGGGEALVPAVKDWLVEMDGNGRRIVMRLPSGLLEQ